jgi:hypothetical protein
VAGRRGSVGVSVTPNENAVTNRDGAKSLESLAFRNSRGGTRTRDPSIMSAVL